MDNQTTKRILIILAYIAGTFFILRAIAEPFLISYSKPDTYKHDWGGPTYAGVLIVHMGLGVISLVAFMYFRKKKSK